MSYVDLCNASQAARLTHTFAVTFCTLILFRGTAWYHAALCRGQILFATAD